MRRRVLLIRHMLEKREDRVARWLTARGDECQVATPAGGDVLPDSLDDIDAVVVYGGIQSANDDRTAPYIGHEIEWIRRWLEAERPLFGICLGAQLVARALSASVGPHHLGVHEIGFCEVHPVATDGLFLTRPLNMYQWHREGFELPSGAECLATGGAFPNQAYRFGVRTYGVQFHPEVTPQIIRSWIRESGEMLSEPGAHSMQRQIRDAERFDQPMADWLHEFLARWREQW